MYIASRLAQLSANLLSILIIVSLFYSFFFFKALRWRSNVEDDSRWRWGRWKTIGARSAWTRTKGEWKWAIPAKSNLLHPTHISLACSTGFTFEQSLLVCYIVSLFPVVLVHFFFSFFPAIWHAKEKRKTGEDVRIIYASPFGSKDERTSSLFYIPIITSEMCNKEPPIYVHWCLQHCGWIDGERQTHYLHIRGQSLPPWIFVNWNSQELSTSLAAAVPCSERN